MTLRLDSVMNCSVRLKGAGGPQITVEMEYLKPDKGPSPLPDNRRMTRNRYTGQTVLRSDVLKWMEQLGWMVRALMNSSNISFNLPIKITLGAEFPTKVYPDLHNLVKVVCDAIKEGLGIDDKFYSVDVGQPWVVACCEPKLIITIQEG